MVSLSRFRGGRPYMDFGGPIRHSTPFFQSQIQGKTLKPKPLHSSREGILTAEQVPPPVLMKKLGHNILHLSLIVPSIHCCDLLPPMSPMLPSRLQWTSMISMICTVHIPRCPLPSSHHRLLSLCWDHRPPSPHHHLLSPRRHPLSPRCHPPSLHHHPLPHHCSSSHHCPPSHRCRLAPICCHYADLDMADHPPPSHFAVVHHASPNQHHL
jgi:hypothetical protein